MTNRQSNNFFAIRRFCLLLRLFPVLQMFPCLVQSTISLADAWWDLSTGLPIGKSIGLINQKWPNKNIKLERPDLSATEFWPFCTEIDKKWPYFKKKISSSLTSNSRKVYEILFFSHLHRQRYFFLKSKCL